MLALACCWLQTWAVWNNIHDGYQKNGSVHVHNPIWRDHKFHDCINPLDVYDDLELFQHFWFPRCELLEVTEDFNNDMQYLISTKASLSALGGQWGWSCICMFHCTLSAPFFRSFSLQFYSILVWKLTLFCFILFCFIRHLKSPWSGLPTVPSRDHG